MNKFYVQKNHRTHCGNQVKSAGINSLVKNDVTNLITAMGPTKTVNSLRTRYLSNGEDEKLKALPTVRQCTNYKRNCLLSKDQYRTYAGVNEQLHDRRIESKLEFDNMTNVESLIYLGGYNGMLEPEELEQDKENVTQGSGNNFGFVFTNKKLLNSARDAVVEHGDEGISTGWDGTWNLCHNGWVLANFGSVSTRYCTEDRKYGQTFNLFGYCLAKSESIMGFREFCRLFVKTFNCFFHPLTMKLRFFSCDHSNAIAKGLFANFSSAKLLSCWPHVIQNVRKKRGLLYNA